ncbi:hypothetical protein OTB20_22455 [Streptomyces sp. H27-H1]|uniref:hypothetical protein n=1 Tax=Streptomyces sp. H27-H1 TaxID=2996461 RepID=UPI002270C0E2|nr:hypothetical protein [Streptomyces sp. H27-H1]MCY0928923.1 hypothetical protein [Streptomyces sp. H27-H1]
MSGLCARGADLGAAAPVSVLCAGLLVSPYLLVAPEGLAAPPAVALVGRLGLGTTALGYLLFTRGVAGLCAAPLLTSTIYRPRSRSGSRPYAPPARAPTSGRASATPSSSSPA